MGSARAIDTSEARSLRRTGRLALRFGVGTLIGGAVLVLWSGSAQASSSPGLVSGIVGGVTTTLDPVLGPVTTPVEPLIDQVVTPVVSTVDATVNTVLAPPKSAPAPLPPVAPLDPAPLPIPTPGLPSLPTSPAVPIDPGPGANPTVPAGPGDHLVLPDLPGATSVGGPGGVDGGAHPTGADALFGIEAGERHAAHGRAVPGEVEFEATDADRITGLGHGSGADPDRHGTAHGASHDLPAPPVLHATFGACNASAATGGSGAGAAPMAVLGNPDLAPQSSVATTAGTPSQHLAAAPPLGPETTPD